jgi:hypothetical protein
MLNFTQTSLHSHIVKVIKQIAMVIVVVMMISYHMVYSHSSAVSVTVTVLVAISVGRGCKARQGEIKEGNWSRMELLEPCRRLRRVLK